MVAVPDLVAAYEQGAIDLREHSRPCSSAMIAHCELMGDRVADPGHPAGPQRPAGQGLAGQRGGLRLEVRDALYWPWIKVFDPATGTNKLRAAERPHGRHLGPQRRHPRRAQGPGQRGGPRRDQRCRRSITKAEHDLLNPVGINCIRALPRPRHPGLGCPHPVQRPGLALPQRPPALQLPRGVHPDRAPSGWSSSPTTTQLWARIRRTISAFLVNEWRKGALFGRTPDEAFYVKCDRETNPAEGIDAGQVVCQIGVAPVKPAEFVIFQLSQFSGGTSLVNE